MYKDTGSGGNDNNNNNNGGPNDSGNGSNISGSKKDNEPKTGDITPIEIYATLATFLLLAYYHSIGKRNMYGLEGSDCFTKVFGI